MPHRHRAHPPHLLNQKQCPDTSNVREHSEKLPFSYVFSLKNNYGRGRCSMLTSAILVRILQDFMSGSLYTAYLTVNGFSIVNVGIISFLPLLASLFGIFSPVILERFQKRRWILAAGRLGYYTLTILGLTLLPRLVHDHTARLFWFGLLVFLGGVLNHIFSTGYTVWQLNFIDGHVRATYFSYQQIITTILGTVSFLCFGLLADSLRGTPNEAAVLTWIRMIGYAFAIVDIVILSLPKEYPYSQQEERVRFSHIFTLPFKSKNFLTVTGIMVLWTFSLNAPLSAFNYYLLNTVKISVTMTSLYTVSYSVFLIILAPSWRKLLHRIGWIKTYAYAALLHAPSVFFCAFVCRENVMWLYPLMMLLQGFAGVGLNYSYLGIPYVHMPRHDETNYIAFYTLTGTLGAFLGQATATVALQLIGDRAIHTPWMAFGAVQLLLVIGGIGHAVCAFMFLRFLKKTAPEPQVQSYEI